MHSSQDEQDNRNYAKFAKMAMVEPADADEALRFVAAAYELSEKFDTPVLFRTTTRTSHAQGVARLGERVPPAEPLLTLDRDPSKHLMMPHNAMPRHAFIEQRLLDAGGVRGDDGAQPCRDGRRRAWASSPPAPPTAPPRRRSRRPASSSWA